MDRLRVVTYNIHKCRGMDRRVRPARIVEVLREIDADVVALQEVLSIRSGTAEDDQARFIAEGLGFEYRMGVTRRLHGGLYGNLILSRLPMRSSYFIDLSHPGREHRGCLRTDLVVASQRLVHIYNVHLGTAFVERRRQARKLVGAAILSGDDVTGTRILLGDFNDWTRGLPTRLFSQHFGCDDVRIHLGRRRTYPGVLPFLHLDHIYLDPNVSVERALLHRSRTALIASDHLPLVADLRLEERTS